MTRLHLFINHNMNPFIFCETIAWRCPTRWRRCATTRTTGTPRSRLPAPCSGATPKCSWITNKSSDVIISWCSLTHSQKDRPGNEQPRRNAFREVSFNSQRFFNIETQGADRKAADRRSGAGDRQMGNPCPQVDKYDKNAHFLSLSELRSRTFAWPGKCKEWWQPRPRRQEMLEPRDERLQLLFILIKTLGDPPLQVIHSEGERKAAKALTEAALLLEQNSACLPLRYLQVFHYSSGGSKIMGDLLDCIFYIYE